MQEKHIPVKLEKALKKKNASGSISAIPEIILKQGSAKMSRNQYRFQQNQTASERVKVYFTTL